MKYCPYCGASLPEGTVSFCPECGESLQIDTTPKQKEKTPVKERRPAKKKKPQKPRPSQKKETSDPPPVDDYDGYYDDRLPIDEGHRRGGMDKGIIKKVAVLVLCLMVVIGACLAILYVI